MVTAICTRYWTRHAGRCTLHHTTPHLCMQGVLVAHPSPKKAFAAVASDKLLLPLLSCACPAAPGTAGLASVSTAQSTEAASVLQAALLQSCHIIGKPVCSSLPYTHIAANSLYTSLLSSSPGRTTLTPSCADDRACRCSSWAVGSSSGNVWRCHRRRAGRYSNRPAIRAD